MVDGPVCLYTKRGFGQLRQGARSMITTPPHLPDPQERDLLRRIRSVCHESAEQEMISVCQEVVSPVRGARSTLKHENG